MPKIGMRAKRLRRGKVKCGARMLSVVCPECRTRNHYGVDEQCRTCGHPQEYVCHCPVLPGARCKFHVGQESAENITPKEAALRSMSASARDIYNRVARHPLDRAALREFWQGELALHQARRAEKQDKGLATEGEDKAITSILHMLTTNETLKDFASAVGQDAAFDPEKLSTEELERLEELLEKARPR